MYGLEIQYSKGVNYAQVDINKLSTILIKIKARYLRFRQDHSKIYMER